MKGKEKWYAIASDCSLKEYVAPNTTSRFEYWVKEFDTGRRNLTNWGTNWIIHEYEFYDGNVKPIKYEIDGWQILRCYESDFKNAYDFGIRFDILDPNGEKRTINSMKSSHNGLEKGLKLFHDIAKFNSWQMYDLNKLNIQLENKNIELTKQVKEYEDTLNEFKSCKLYLDLSGELNLLKDDKNKLEKIILNKGLTMNLFEKWIKHK